MAWLCLLACNSFRAGALCRGTAAALALLAMACDAALAQTAEGPFTQAEVAAGHSSYHGYCAQCHGDDLGGGGDAPPLTGGLFQQDWSKWTVRMLYQFVAQDMPIGLEGELDAKTYSNIVSYLLAANGAKPGHSPFDRNSSVKIGDIADGHTVAALTGPPADAAP